VSDPTVTIEILSGSGLDFGRAAFRLPPDREVLSVNPGTPPRRIMSGVRLPDGTRRRSLAVVLPPDQECTLN
jgi:hypothetical protein